MPMTETGGRRRNTLLAGLVLLKKLAPDITQSEILAFLYVAENPGVRVKELAALMETTEATASRASRSLLDAGEPGARAPGRGWLLMASNGREAVSRHLYLTEAGVELVQRLDALIESARLIGVRAAPAELRVRR
ncbi:MarR family transcriptional regulator [Brevundimonas sp. TWP2-3-2]|uniref:MarR family transcriptional regulator n=1 Tax=unclassified Brevundimonas TaxID=2622653 RepID=UPI003CE8A74C